MKIYFVRHGHPNYTTDSLTELGHRQAAAAAQRLKGCGIGEIYSSSKGRAVQTAEYTASLLGLPVIQCDFMREITWGPLEGEEILEKGHPWKISDIFAGEGRSLNDPDWESKEPFCKSTLPDAMKRVIDGFDAWLCELGYKREGEYYRVVGENTDRTVAMFSHGGAGSVAWAHLFNLPFIKVCGFCRPDFTSVTVIEFSNEMGELCFPKVRLYNDARHIEGLDSDNVYGI